MTFIYGLILGSMIGCIIGVGIMCMAFVARGSDHGVTDD